MEKNAHILEDISKISSQINKFQTMCYNARVMLDEGTHKLDAILNVINGLKNREQTIMAAGENPQVVQQISEEQVDSLLEMLKSPAFHNIVRSMLLKWAEGGQKNQ